MPSSKEQQRERGLAALVRHIREPEGQGLKVSEAEVWAYASNVLEPDERDRVMRAIAASEAAREKLARIRESLEAAGETAPVSIAYVLEQARRWAAERAAAMGRDLAAVCQIVVRTRDGLLAAGLRWAGPVILSSPAPALQPVCLDDQAEGAGGKALQRIDIQGPEGMTAAVLRLPDGRIDIDVTLSGPTLQGQVELVRLEGREGVCHEEPTGVDAPVRGGRARLEKCPEGILKVRAPDGREMILGITPAEPY